MVNPTLAGTRPAGAMAAAWAVHRLLGTDGYRALAPQAHEATLALVRGHRGDPRASASSAGR